MALDIQSIIDALQEIGDDEAVAVANHEALSQEAQEAHEEALAMQEKEEEEAEAAAHQAVMDAYASRNQ